MRKCLLVLVVTLTLGFAPAPFPKPAKPDRRTDLQKMQGVWVQVSQTRGGKPWPPPGEPTFRKQVIVSGKRMRMTYQFRGDGIVISEWVVTLDPARHPKAMDMKAVGRGGFFFRVYPERKWFP